MSAPAPIRRWPIWLVSAGLAGLASWLFLRGQPYGLPVDDAYIHLVYARNLAQGLGWCFNAGEPSLGTSSPLWVILIRGLLPFFLPLTALRVLAFSGLLLSTILLAEMAPSVPWLRIPFHLPAISSLSTLVILLFAFSGNLLWISFCGMESIFFLALGLLAIRSLVFRPPGVLTAVSLSLLLLTRLEGALLWAILFGWWWHGVLRKEKPSEQHLPSQVLWFVIPLLCWLGWISYTWFHFGLVLPETMSGKLASNLFNSGLSFRGMGLFLERHLIYLSRWNLDLCALLLLSLLGLTLNQMQWPEPLRLSEDNQRRQIGVKLAAIWAIGNLLLYALFFRSTEALTPYHYLRYQIPLFPALVLGAAWMLVPFLEHQNSSRRVLVSALCAVLVGVYGYSFSRWLVIYDSNVTHLQQSHQAAALWAKANLPEDARLACFDIGSLKYFSGRYVIDLGGLTDPAIHPYLREKRVGPYLKEAKATHYLALDRPPEEGLTGVRKDDGTLYHLRELARFEAPDYPTPVRLHSLAVIVYALQ